MSNIMFFILLKLFSFYINKISYDFYSVPPPSLFWKNDT